MTDEQMLMPTKKYTQGYPTISELCDFKRPELTENIVKESCIVVDTNILLIPYGLDTTEPDELISFFDKENVHITEHSYTEFSIQRQSRIAQLVLNVKAEIERLTPIQLRHSPVCLKATSYTKLNDNLKKLEDSSRLVINNLKNLMKSLLSWQFEDPVSKRYEAIFSNRVLHKCDKLSNSVISDMFKRSEDAKKPENLEGDLIIWSEMLQYAKDNKKDIIFVSHDKKDVFVNIDKKWVPIERQDVSHEFFKLSGQYIYIVSLFHLLKLLNYQKSTISKIGAKDDYFDLEESVVQMDLGPLDTLIVNRIYNAFNSTPLGKFLLLLNSTSKEIDDNKCNN